MKKNEIKVGGKYIARVSGKITTVRVDEIREGMSASYWPYRNATAYDVTNLATGRKLTFRSAMKFRRDAEAVAAPSNPAFWVHVEGKEHPLLTFKDSKEHAQKVAESKGHKVIDVFQIDPEHVQQAIKDSLARKNHPVTVGS